MKVPFVSTAQDRAFPNMSADRTVDVYEPEILITQEIEALGRVARVVEKETFDRAACHIAGNAGAVIVTGVGKSAIVARSIAASLATVGIRAMFIDPVGLHHGELGALRLGDTVIMVSRSGSTEELIRLLKPMTDMGLVVLPIVGEKHSTLGVMGHAIVTGVTEDRFYRLPAASSIAAIALGHALAVAVAKLRHVNDETLAATHPGGTIGKELQGR